MNNIKIKYKNLEKICDEKRFINALYFLLKDNDYCFLRGSFIFEDNNEYLFNLLTIGKIFNNIDNIYKKECKKITRDRGTICFTSHDYFLLDKKFQKKRKTNPTMYKIDDIYSKEKLMYKYTIPPLKSLSMYEKIINEHILLKCNDVENIFKVILFYPFKIYNKNYEKKMLYLKLEESRCFSISHISNDFQSKKIKNKDSLNLRREKDNYSIRLYKKDIIFYTDIINKYIKDDKIKKNIMNTVEDYNDNIRVGSEFFIPNEILLILFDIYYKKLWEYNINSNTETNISFNN